MHVPLLDLDDLGGDRVRHLLLRAAAAPARGRARRSAPRAACRSRSRPGSSSGPSGSSETGRARSSSMPSPVFALTGWSAWKSPSVAACLHLRRDVPGLQPVDLVDDDDHRHAEREHAPRDEAVARADPLARAHDEQDDVDVVGDRLVDAPLHPLGQGVDRPLPAGQVDEHELRVVASCRRRGCGAASCAGLVGDDRDLRARRAR